MRLATASFSPSNANGKLTSVLKLAALMRRTAADTPKARLPVAKARAEHCLLPQNCTATIVYHPEEANLAPQNKHNSLLKALLEDTNPNLGSLPPACAILAPGFLQVDGAPERGSCRGIRPMRKKSAEEEGRSLTKSLANTHEIGRSCLIKNARKPLADHCCGIGGLISRVLKNKQAVGFVAK